MPPAKLLLLLVITLAALSPPALAHHSYAAFDQTRKLTVEGTVRALEWTNPHIWVWIDVADGNGGATTFGFESNAPSELARFFGWTKHSLTVGERVTVDYSPLKSGRNGGALRTITFPDGRVLRTPRSNPAYQTGPRGAASIAEPRGALPDWSGAWVVPFDLFAQENLRQRKPGDPASPPLVPDLAARLAKQTLDNPARQPTNSERCLPNGMPNVMRYPFAIEFLFTPGRVTILLEQDSMIRRIYTDGRPHSTDADPSYAGDSIAHWEGETLVVHTTAISPRAERMAGVHTSGQATVTERIFLKDPNHLQIDSVVEDPVALTTPWRRTRAYERIDTRFYERVCLDNNRDVDGGEPNLTPPKL